MVLAPGRARLVSTTGGRLGTARERSQEGSPAALRPCRGGRRAGRRPSRGCLAWLPLGVVGEALPVDDDARLVADDPGVMTGRAHHEVAGPELHLLTVVHHDLHASGDEIAGVGR